MKGINLVINGVSVTIEEAGLTEIQAILKQATECQLQVLKHEDETTSKRDELIYQRLNAFVRHGFEYISEHMQKAHDFTMAQLGLKLEIAKAKRPKLSVEKIR